METFDEAEIAEEMLHGLERGNIYTVSRRLDGEKVFRQCSYYGFDLGKHVFKTVDDGVLYPPKVIHVGSNAVSQRVSPPWTEYNEARTKKVEDAN